MFYYVLFCRDSLGSLLSSRIMPILSSLVSQGKVKFCSAECQNLKLKTTPCGKSSTGPLVQHAFTWGMESRRNDEKTHMKCLSNSAIYLHDVVYIYMLILMLYMLSFCLSRAVLALELRGRWPSCQRWKRPCFKQRQPLRDHCGCWHNSSVSEVLIKPHI